MSSSTLPPPPSIAPPSPNSPTFLSARRSGAGQQQRLSPLTPHFSPAQLANPHLQTNYPSAAYSLATPTTRDSTSHAGFLPSVISSSRSPSGEMSSYNPQQWGSAGTVGGAYVPHSATAAQARARGTRDATGMEGVTSAVLPFVQNTI